MLFDLLHCKLYSFKKIKKRKHFSSKQNAGHILKQAVSGKLHSDFKTNAPSYLLRQWLLWSRSKASCSDLLGGNLEAL